MKSVLVCGSAAIDFLGTYAGSFHDYQEKFPIHGLNISLQLKSLRTSFGGCGMNITYGLHKLGVPVLPLTSTGLDFEDHYLPHLEDLGIDCRYICVDDTFEHSAHCIIFSDVLGNQITAFNAGASLSEQRILPSEIARREDLGFVMLAPEEAPVMLRQARDLASLDLPVMFDPGQGLAEFTRDEIRELLSLSTYVICNDHEWEILQTNSGLSAAEIIDQHEAIVTRGPEGVDIFSASGDPIRVPAVETETVLEPTGCGDAFRAGYLFGLMHNLPARQCAELGCVVASHNIRSRETQRYEIDRATLLVDHEASYGYAISLHN